MRARLESPRASYATPGVRIGTTRAPRRRQLPTKRCHAALLFGVIRAYQPDSSSKPLHRQPCAGVLGKSSMLTREPSDVGIDREIEGAVTNRLTAGPSISARDGCDKGCSSPRDSSPWGKHMRRDNITGRSPHPENAEGHILAASPSFRTPSCLSPIRSMRTVRAATPCSMAGRPLISSSRPMATPSPPSRRLPQVIRRLTSAGECHASRACTGSLLQRTRYSGSR